MSVRSYLVFYDKLWAKYSSKEFDDDNPLPTTVVLAWNHKIRHKDRWRHITELRFNAPPRYFHDRRPKKSVKEGLVDLIDDRFVRAVLYIEDELTDERINKIDEWEKEAELLKVKFEEKYLEKKNISQISDEEKEKIFFEILTSKPEVLEPYKITRLLVNYFSAINSKNYSEAWKHLSSSLKKESMWDDDSKRFKDSFADVHSIGVTSIRDFSFEFRTVKCTVDYYETGLLYDVETLIRASQSSDSQERNDAMELICWIETLHERYWKGKTISCDKLNWKKRSLEEVKSLQDHEITDYHFQKFFSICTTEPLRKLKLNRIFPYGPSEYNSHFMASVVCVFDGRRWVIDEILPGLFGSFLGEIMVTSFGVGIIPIDEPDDDSIYQ